MTKDEKLFANGFNDGYLLKEYDPKLLAKLLKGQDRRSEYMQGLEEGSKQREKEKFVQQFKEKDKSKDHEKEM